MADDPSNVAGTEGARSLLNESMAAMAELLNQLRAINARLAQGNVPDLPELIEKRMAYAALSATILDEVARHESRDLEKEDGGTVPDLDLDDIRSRIGRRLDRIRDARGAGGLSEGPFDG